MQWTPLQKLSITSGAALVLLGLGGALSYYYASRLITADGMVVRTNQNIEAIHRLVVGTRDAERATKAYVVRGDSMARQALQTAQSTVEDALDAAVRSSEDNPLQRRLLDQLAPQVAASFDEFRSTVLIRDRAGPDSARKFLMRELPPHETDSLMAIVDRMHEEELRVLAEHARHRSRTGATTLRVILLSTALAFLLAGLALHPMAVAARKSSNAGPSDAARALAEMGVVPFGAVLGAVIAPNGAGGFSVLHATDPVLDTVSGDLAAGVAETLRTGEPAMAASRVEREQRFGTLAALDTCDAPGAVLFVPLVHAASNIGVLLLAFAGDHAFGPDEVALASTLGRLGGPAIACPPTS